MQRDMGIKKGMGDLFVVCEIGVIFGCPHDKLKHIGHFESDILN
jgi:hypothetical protein